MKGGSCGLQMCQAGGSHKKRVFKIRSGYRATKRDKKYLLLFKKGKSIGFTMRSSLKAKGLIPRSNGTRRISKKYR